MARVTALYPSIVCMVTVIGPKELLKGILRRVDCRVRFTGSSTQPPGVFSLLVFVVKNRAVICTLDFMGKHSGAPDKTTSRRYRIARRHPVTGMPKRDLCLTKKPNRHRERWPAAFCEGVTLREGYRSIRGDLPLSPTGGIFHVSPTRYRLFTMVKGGQRRRPKNISKEVISM